MASVLHIPIEHADDINKLYLDVSLANLPGCLLSASVTQ